MGITWWMLTQAVSIGSYGTLTIMIGTWYLGCWGVGILTGRNRAAELVLLRDIHAQAVHELELIHKIREDNSVDETQLKITSSS